MAEANLRFAELAAAQSELASTLASKDARIRELDAQLSKLRELGELVWRQNMYWGADGSGPFCPKCCHADRPKRVPMARDEYVFSCAVCAPYRGSSRRLG